MTPLRRSFSNAAARYDEAAVLAAEVGRRMAERLDLVRFSPRRVADIGCATGDGIHELTARYPDAWPLAVDFARPMLQAAAARSGLFQRLRGRAPRLLNADVTRLPLAANRFDLVWSNLMLHWLADPLPAFRECHRILAPEGLLTFSALGPDTLRELRAACAACGLTSPLRVFHDMHDLGDMLVATGFADPVMDMEIITLTYRSPRGLLQDQRHLGVRDALLGRLGWRDWRRVLAAWGERRMAEGLPASFEIVYGHAWKPAPRTTAEGRPVIPLVPR